ncbi:MAG: hypothetical protein NTY50_03570 [Methylobacter sp.]|nr:hypothetical protein [Methylobacter sp.]
MVAPGVCCRRPTFLRTTPSIVIFGGGAWERIHDTLRADVRRKAGRHKHPAGSIDSQSKTTALAGLKGYDAAKCIQGRKRHILVDTLGLIPVIVVTAADIPEREEAKLIL